MINVVGKSSYVKPSLTEKHRMFRLKFTLNQIVVSNPNQLVYRDHHNNIHVDEKYFYTTPPKRNLKYFPDHDWHHTDDFDGKCGLIFYGDIVNAQRNSRNRPRGTLLLQPKNVDHEEFILGQIKDDGIIHQIIEGEIQRP